MTGFVTGVSWQQMDGHTVRVEWIHDGRNQSDWFASWRLTRCALDEGGD